MFDFLERDTDCQRFEQLLSTIKHDKCIAFTGAGLSKPLGYRVWEEGICGTDDDHPTLIQLAGVDNDKAKNKSLPDVIDECKIILNEKYFEFLLNEFGRINKAKHHPNLFSLWKSNYKHLITTNFDASLYDNREDCENIVTYPSKELKIQPKRTLFYLHGRAFITNSEKAETLNYWLENLVYGKLSYLEAYDPQNGDGAIGFFIYSIIQAFSILFIGFSMKDEDFKNTYKQMKDRWDRYIRKINQHPQREKESINGQYILYPYPLKSEYISDKDYSHQVESFEYWEQLLNEINISVIAYKKMDKEEHKGLSLALEYIMDEAPFKNKVELSELGIQAFDSGSASINEVSR
ncbi:MAG: SIR2 family protein [Ignavibacteriaceae bacterium]|jgi:hypothetical protein